MKTALKWLVAVLAFLIAAFTALYMGTRGDYPVARLVTEDPSLPSATVAGVRLHMRIVDGPAGAPTIFVLHGGPGGDFRSLQALDTLSDRYRVVFYDQRGAGLSERVSADILTLDGHLEELQAVIDFVSPDRPSILIGHSWGAMLAVAHLGKTRNGIAGAVLIEPGFLDAGGRTAWEAASSAFMRGPRYMLEAVVTGFRAQHVAGPDAFARDDFLVGHMVGVFTNHPDNPYHCGDGYTAPGWRFGALSSNTWRNAPTSDVDRLGSNTRDVTTPVLLLAGSCNRWLGPLQNQHRDRFANAELIVVPDAGHDVVWDNPQATLAAIRAFLNRLESVPSKPAKSY